MKALIKERPQPGLSLTDIPMPEIRAPDDVLFKVEYCAICVGETKVYDWNEWAAADKTLQLPTVLGHEASGVVVEVGPGVSQFKPGDRIVNDPMIYCGHCRQCRAGYTNMCENREIYGKRRGAFAEYAVLPERVICPLPDKLSLEEGAVLENLGIAVHAVEIERHDPGDWAVILGAGPIGILAAQALVAWGVNTVITDLSDARLEFARQYGGTFPPERATTQGSPRRATAQGHLHLRRSAAQVQVSPLQASRLIVVDVKKEDPVAVVKDLTHGRGADCVIEMAANQTVLDQAFEMVRIRGTIVTIGTFNGPVSFNPFFSMTRREIKLQSVMGRNWETWRRMVQLIESDKVNLAPLVTQVLPFEEYARGFELVKGHDAMKVLLRAGRQ